MCDEANRILLVAKELNIINEYTELDEDRVSLTRDFHATMDLCLKSDGARSIMTETDTTVEDRVGMFLSYTVVVQSGDLARWDAPGLVTLVLALVKTDETYGELVDFFSAEDTPRDNR